MPRLPRIYTLGMRDRPPYWRHDRVSYLLRKSAEHQVMLDADDVGVRHFYACCQALHQALTPEERLLVRGKYPGITEAIELRKYAPLESLGFFEGFLLTDCDLGWLCHRFSMDPAVVVWYEQLFFDVWDRRDANFWLETEVIKPAVYAGRPKSEEKVRNDSAWERACAYRRYGFHGGIVALELFATGFLTTDAKPTYRDIADTFIKKAMETAVSNEGAAMVQSRRRLNKTEGEFIKLALDLAERSSLKGDQEVLVNIQKALATVVPVIGEDAKAELTQLAIDDPDKAMILLGATELRHIEVTKLHLGLEMSPETRELVSSFQKHRERIDG